MVQATHFWGMKMLSTEVSPLKPVNNNLYIVKHENLRKAYV